MGKTAQVVREDLSNKYESRIQKLVEEDRVGGARKLVEEALRESPDDPTLLSWKEVLAPGRVFGSRPVNLEGTAEERWFAAQAGQYSGQWVAVLGENLLAHAPTLQELSTKLKKLAPRNLPVVHHIE
jgi:uncharacterized protein DUF5678